MIFVYVLVFQFQFLRHARCVYMLISYDVVWNNNFASQTVFASYADRVIHFMELPGEIPNR